MFDAVNSPTGTAYLSRTYNTKKLMCGKTATSSEEELA